MYIGMIGGIGPAATEFYYHNLVAVFHGGSSQLDLTIVHADVNTLVAGIASGAEVVVLAGSDLFLAFDGYDCGFATLYGALIHINAIHRRAVEFDNNQHPRRITLQVTKLHEAQ